MWPSGMLKYWLQGMRTYDLFRGTWLLCPPCHNSSPDIAEGSWKSPQLSSLNSPVREAGEAQRQRAYTHQILNSVLAPEKNANQALKWQRQENQGDHSWLHSAFDTSLWCMRPCHTCERKHTHKHIQKQNKQNRLKLFFFNLKKILKALENLLTGAVYCHSTPGMAETQAHCLVGLA